MKTKTFKIKKKLIKMVPVTGMLNSEKEADFIAELEQSFAETGIKFKTVRTDGRAQVWRDLEYTKKADERQIY
jgi:hypothetical protein